MKYCYYILLFPDLCLSLSEWKDVATMVGIFVAVPGGLFAAYKTIQEIRKSYEQKAEEGRQRERDEKLKRIEFTLAQHRRLFDDPVLYSVLCLIDGDGAQLKAESMWDAKRKFITFFEEIALLVNSGEINIDVALYMFGYYAYKARTGKNFACGIALEPRYWRLFFDFADKAEKYLAQTTALTSVGDLKI